MVPYGAAFWWGHDVGIKEGMSADRSGNRFTDGHVVREGGDSHYVLLENSRVMHLLHSAQQANDGFAQPQWQAQRALSGPAWLHPGSNEVAVRNRFGRCP